MQLPILTPFAQTTAENIASDSLGQIVIDNVGNPVIEINDADIYKIESERLAQLNAPMLFEGYLSVQMRGTPAQAACQFLPQFADGRGQALHGVRREGCVLRLNQFTAYLLPQSMFELSELIEQANQPSVDVALRWRVVERAKNVGERVHFEGLPDDTVFQNSHAVAMDVVMNADGSVSIQPRINGVTEATYLNHKERLNEEGRTILVMTEVRGEGEQRHVVRQITETEVIKAHQRIEAVGRIAREDVGKFLDNPAAFILNDDEAAADVAIDFGSYRITGMSEPYVGYFGSKNLDSPIKQALMQDGDPQVHKAICQLVVESVDKQSVAEVKALIQRIEQAEQSNTPQIELPNGETLPQAGFETAKAALNKVAQKATEQAGGTADNLVIQIKPNDDKSVDFDFVTRKPLSEIRGNHQEQSDLFNAIAYPPKSYQVAGVNWLKDLFEADYRGGILADDMGLGKTYQMVVFMNYLIGLPQYQGASGQRMLIVAPTILLDNWRNEIDKFVVNAQARAKFKVKVVRGNDLAYRNLKKQGYTRPYNSFDVANFLIVEEQPNVLIISYETLSNYQFSFADKAFNWGCVIYDEAHKIKNPNAQISQAARALSSLTPFSALLTGTPIENELRDLWALFDVFDPTHLGSWKAFKKEFVTNTVDVDTRLRKRVDNYVLRRFKKDYLGNELPQKIKQTHAVQFSTDEAAGYLKIKNQEAVALVRLHGLKAFGLHPELQNAANQNVDLNAFSKTVELLRLLQNIQSKDEKAIIFVMSRVAQDALRFGIQTRFGINVSIINGDNNSPAQVQDKLGAFKATEGFAVIILSTLAAGVGLTITEANHVIHYERWWNASKEDQASDRAYRIGATRDVYIHHIVGTLPRIDDSPTLSFDQALNQLITQKRTTAGYLVPPQNINTADIIDATMQATLREKIAAMDWQEFEVLVKKIYEVQGFECELTPAYPAREYGADIVGKKMNETIVIQCKHSQQNNTKDETVIYQLQEEAREHYKASRLIAVTNSQFSLSASKLANKYDITLVEQGTLEYLLKNLKIII
jgi:superfamily II DNA or RNA helicase/HJR/Mrr/RecB family endonuclease